MIAKGYLTRKEAEVLAQAVGAHVARELDKALQPLKERIQSISQRCQALEDRLKKAEADAAKPTLRVVS